MTGLDPGTPAIVVHGIAITVDGFRTLDSWRSTMWEDERLLDPADLEPRHIAAYVAGCMARMKWGPNATVDVHEFHSTISGPGSTEFHTLLFDGAYGLADVTTLLVSDQHVEALRSLLVAADRTEPRMARRSSRTCSGLCSAMRTRTRQTG